MSKTVLIARCPEHGLHGERTECFVCRGPVEQVRMVPAPVGVGREQSGFTPLEIQQDKRIRLLESALSELAERHHRSLGASKLHDPEHIEDWRKCPAGSCIVARQVLSAPDSPGRAA